MLKMSKTVKAAVAVFGAWNLPASSPWKPVEPPNLSVQLAKPPTTTVQTS